MNFTDIFIKRPVFATVLSLLIFMVGIRAFYSLSIREYPKVATSVVSISTVYAGATPDVMEGFVSSPIEYGLADVEGLDYITSSSSQGVSQVTLYFRLGYDVDKALTEVTSKISTVRGKLPRDINQPIIMKEDPNAQAAIWLSFSSKQMSPQAVTDYLMRVIQPQMMTLPGVGDARIFGERAYAMRVWLNPHLMAAHDVTATDIKQTLLSNNLQAPSGRIETALQEFNVSATTDVATPQQFNSLVIRNKEGRLIRLQDVAHVELGSAEDRTSVIINDNNAVAMGIVPRSTANAIDVTREVIKLLPTLQKNMPLDLKAEVAWDSSKFIASSIHEVIRTVIEAAVFVILVILLFLGSIRAVIIPMVTIPLSLIGVCTLMLMLGYSLNTLTLLAWVLAIGMVVDDAIVVSENLHRHIEKGGDRVAAAIIGTREISLAIIAMTLTLAAVYAPIGFMTGLTGSLFGEFAFTLAGSVIISGFIALTLTPMMCSKILRPNSPHGLPARIEAISDKVMHAYKRLLVKVLDRRIIVAFIAGLIYISCYFLFTTLNIELVPLEDPGYFRTIVFSPSTANLKYTEKYTQQLIPIYKQLPEYAGFGIINGIPEGVNSAISWIVLKPWDERKRNVNQIIQAITPQIFSIPGVKAFPFNMPDLPGASGMMPIQFVLKTTGSIEDLYKAVQTVMDAAKKNPGLNSLDTDLKLNKSQINLEINRNKAGDMGVSMADIGDALTLMLSQPPLGRFAMSGRSYDVIPQLLPEFRQNASNLNDIDVRTATGQLVPLSNIISISEKVVPNSLQHFQQSRAATITANLSPGYSLGEALAFIEKTASKVSSNTLQYDYSGLTRQFVQASGAMGMTFLFALIFIYLVLGAQFESFRDPLIILLSVPLATAGALLFLHLTHSTINVYTQIGLVTLIGLISKHGILMVEFANQLQDGGKSIREAIVEAASVRLRPILMTTAAMILSAVPLAMASGAGSEARRQIGWTIIGGMGIGTLFTLFVIPVAYTLFARKRKVIEIAD
ncbi:efflux RND transporter permease subunit [soil metagenome]